MSEIKHLKPEVVWKNFHALTQVPRPSGHLDKVEQFLLNFAKEVGVEAFKDEAGNIVMRKPATPGMENRKTITLQAHMDMVPQKSTYIDGEWVKARNTTLGSDNGMGVAAILAVMEATDIQHGPIEGLITADEETGMYGANDLPEGELKGDILLNLDSETWGKFVIGSAGGIDVTSVLDYQEVDTDSEDVALRVTLKGLKGGHSGLEIHKGRANANKLMVRFVREAIEDCEARLVSWHGGNMRNAIPFNATVVLTMPKENVEDVKALVEDWKNDFIAEYNGIEEGIEFYTENVETPAKQVPEEIQDNLINAIYACHNGVMRMIPAIPSVVETSSNLAIIDIENGSAKFKILARSSNEDMKEYIATTLKSCFDMVGMKTTFSKSYGGWDPNVNSEILKLLEKNYRELFGSEAVEQVDHAGLECSIILGKYPKMDVVSLGPTIRSPHTTNERCLISTVEPFWALLKKTFETVPVKE